MVLKLTVLHDRKGKQYGADALTDSHRQMVRRKKK